MLKNYLLQRQKCHNLTDGFKWKVAFEPATVIGCSVLATELLPPVPQGRARTLLNKVPIFSRKYLHQNPRYNYLFLSKTPYLSYVHRCTALQYSIVTQEVLVHCTFLENKSLKIIAVVRRLTPGVAHFWLTVQDTTWWNKEKKQTFDGGTPLMTGKEEM